MENPGASPPQRVTVHTAATLHLTVGGGTRLVRTVLHSPAAATLRLDHGPGPLAVRAEARWVPAEPGSRARATAHGLVVEREELLVAKRDGTPPRRIPLDEPGRAIELEVGDVVEEHLRVINPGERHHVAVTLPLAAGMEPLNPALATAPPEATPSGRITRKPTYVDMGDDRAVFFYTTLPRGTYDLYLRTRATVPGRFNQPPAGAELMYDGAVRGASNGALVIITRPAGEDGAR